MDKPSAHQPLSHHSLRLRLGRLVVGQVPQLLTEQAIVFDGDLPSREGNTGGLHSIHEAVTARDEALFALHRLEIQRPSDVADDLMMVGSGEHHTV